MIGGSRSEALGLGGMDVMMRKEGTITATARHALII